MGGQSPIAFTAFDAYARRFGIEGDDFDFFLRMMMELDAEHLEWVNEQIEAERKKT